MKAKLKKEIIAYIEKNPCEMYWDYRDSLSKEQLVQILSSPDGMLDFENDLYEMNLEFIWETESYYMDNIIDEFELDMDREEFSEHFQEYIGCDLNINQLLNNTPDLAALAVIHSNYDCTNSYDSMDDGPYTYIYEVYQRIKEGVKQKDYEWEHMNGAYGGCLFCFAFKMSIEDLIELKRNFKASITIPKGTQFGFFSSFQGAGSVFEKTTKADMTLSKLENGQTEYDCIDIIADLEQSYSMNDVYGDTSWINEMDVTTN